MKLTKRVQHSVFHLVAVGIVCLGCSQEPKDIRLLRQGLKFELASNVDKATEKYAEAAALGNADAVKKLGDLALFHEYANLSPTKSGDYLTGYDDWLINAKRVLEKAERFYQKAQQSGCTDGMDESLKKLEGCKVFLSDTERKVQAAKEKKAKEDAIRAEQNRQAELRRQEELRREQEEKKRLAEETARREREAAEERRRRESPEYCVEQGLELSDSAFKEVVRAVNFRSKTGNDIYDTRVEREQHDRFLGKRITLRATVDKVETTFFTDEVKLVMRKAGSTISARFDGMSKNEAANIRPGQSFLITGTISNRPVTSSIALDRCTID